MKARRTFLGAILSLFGLAATSHASRADERRPGWVFIPQEEYDRLVSASTPIVARSETLVSTTCPTMAAADCLKRSVDTCLGYDDFWDACLEVGQLWENDKARPADERLLMEVRLVHRRPLQEG